MSTTKDAPDPSHGLRPPHPHEAAYKLTRPAAPAPIPQTVGVATGGAVPDGAGVAAASGAVRVGVARHGYGVFAARSLQTEDLVGRVTGQIIDDPDYSSDYCIDLGGRFSLEPAPPMRFLNHSCEPNCQLVQVEDEDDGPPTLPEVWLEAVRPIAENEELTIDYGWPAEHGIRCQCGSPRCRGWIVASAE